MGATFAAVALVGQQAGWRRTKQPTAREVVGGDPGACGSAMAKKETVDTFKAGNPDAPVTGIAVTMMATLDVLQACGGDTARTSSSPTSRLLQPPGRAGRHERRADPVWQAKREFIEKHGMVVWRFHDHWHRRKPDGILAGMVHAMGWGEISAGRKPVFVHDAGENVGGARSRGGEEAGLARRCESWERPGMKVTRIAFSPGLGGICARDPCAGDG